MDCMSCMFSIEVGEINDSDLNRRQERSEVKWLYHVASRDPDRLWLRRLGSAMHIGKCCKLPICVAVLVLGYRILDDRLLRLYGIRCGIRRNNHCCGSGVMLLYESACCNCFDFKTAALSVSQIRPDLDS
jgi:hypothetical protein